MRQSDSDGRDEAVVISAQEFRRPKRHLTGKSLIAAMQASPHRDIDLEPGRADASARRVLTGAPALNPWNDPNGSSMKPR
jgi:hypothetical protein